MNKFFRLVSMFAIAGVTFAYTSCTDYSEDIDKANTRIDEVGGAVGKLDGRLSTVEGQVKNLETTVSSLQAAQTKADAAIADLQTALGKLQEKHAADIAKLEKDYAAADAALKSEIEGKISTLTTEFTNKVTALATQIAVLQTKVDGIDETVKSIQETIKGLATKEYVDRVFATKDALAEANTAIAALNTALETVQSKVATLDEDLKTVKGDIAGINTKLGEAQTAIAKAQEDATKALGEIAEIKEALKSYALKAEVEAKIEQLVAADLAATDRMNGIDEKIAGIGTQIAGLIEKDTELGEKIAQLFEEKFNKADFADAFKTAYEARFSTDFAEKFAEAWAEYFQPAFDTAFETAWNAKFQGEFDSALEKVLGIYAEKDVLKNKLEALDGKDAELQDKITKLDEKLDQAVEDLNGKITKLDEKVEQYNTELNARIDAVLGIIADRLSSIALVPQYYYDGVPAILFETIAYNPLADDKENEKAVAPKYRGDQNSWLVNQFKKYTSAESVAKFRLNPRTVGVDCADFSLVGDKADYVFTRAAAPAAPVSIVGTTPTYDPTTGYATFKVKKNEKINTDENDNKNLDIVALKAVLKKGLTDAEKKADAKPEVYSEFVHVNEIAYTADELAISDKAKLAGKKADHEYAKTFTEATKNAYVYKMPYDAPFDLKALVATCINSEIFTRGLEAKLDHEALDLERYGLHYEFSVAQSKYPVTSAGTTTDQQTVIKCVDRLGGIFKVMDANGVEYNQEAIGRTPIVRVDLKHGEYIVTRAFIKLVISVDKAYDNISIMDNQKEFVVKCPDTKETMKYDVEKLRKDLYRVLNISHVDFWNLYDVEKAYVKKNGKDLAAFPVPTLVDGIADDGTATKEVYWEFTHGQVGKIGNGANVEGYLVLKNKHDLYSKYPTTVTFKFTADFRLPVVGKEIKVTADIKDIFWETSGDNSVLQANVNVPASETDVAANCYFQTPIAEQPWDKLSVTGLPCGEIPMFRIAKVYMDGKEYKAPVSGIYLAPSTVAGEENISLYKDKSVMKALNSELGLQALIEWYAVGKSGDEYVLHTFMVNFIRPVNLNFPDDIHVKDAKTGGDEITYGFAGLLTDWRGETILPPTPIEIHEEGYHWVKVCSPADHAVVYPGYQKVKKEGYYEFEFEDKEVVIPTATAYHKASITLYDNKDRQHWFALWGDAWQVANPLYPLGPRYLQRPDGTWVEKATVVGYGRSEGEALENARVEANKLSPRYLQNIQTRGWKSDAPVTEVLNSGTVTVTFKTIKNVTYVDAVYETVEPKIEYTPCNPKPGPSSDVYTEGQRIGCWQWQKWANVTPGMTPGRFWDFYGVFTPADDVVLHLERNPDGSYKHVTTDLPDGKLPSKASLEQRPGYKLFYDNVLSPIQYTYHIYIPASIEYGWGVLNQTLVITVDPYNK